MTDFRAARTAMVDCQVRPSDVTRYNIIEGMLAVPREEFVPTFAREVAYSGADIPLGDGRVILEPRVIGKMLDAAMIRPDETVLNISCGYGYTTALIARMAAVVVGVDQDEATAKAAVERLAAQEVVNSIIECGPLAEGSAQHGPYDVIFIEGAIETLPEGLYDQLKDDGRFVTIVSDGETSQCRIGTKTPTSVAWRRVFDATAPVLPGFARKKAFEF